MQGTGLDNPVDALMFAQVGGKFKTLRTHLTLPPPLVDVNALVTTQNGRIGTSFVTNRAAVAMFEMYAFRVALQAFHTAESLLTGRAFFVCGSHGSTTLSLLFTRVTDRAIFAHPAGNFSTFL